MRFGDGGRTWASKALALCCSLGFVWPASGQQLVITEAPMPPAERLRFHGVVLIDGSVEAAVAQGAPVSLVAMAVDQDAAPLFEMAVEVEDTGDYRFEVDAAVLKDPESVVLRISAAAGGLVGTVTPYVGGWVLDQRLIEIDPIRLVVPVTLAGRVLDPEGGAVAGARVLLDPDEPTGPETVTDDEGRYRFESVERVAGRLTVLASGFALSMTPVPELVKAGASAGVGTLATVVLEPGVRLEGHVVDADGDPVEGATVKRQDWNPSETPENVRPVATAATTDSDGRFVLPPVLSREEAADGGQLWVQAEGYRGSWRPNRGVEAGPALYRLEAPIRLERTALLEVRVIDQDGHPVAGADVHCSDREERAGVITMLSTNEDGRVQCSRLRVGALAEVFASAPLHFSASRRLETVRGPTEVELVLESYQAGEVEFRVVDLGGGALDRGVAYLESTSRKDEDGTVETSDSTDLDGRKVFRRIPVGEYRVFAEHHRCRRSEEATIVVEVGQLTRIDASLECRSPAESVGRPITARVVNESGRPVAGATVLLDWEEVAWTDEQGGFSLAAAESRLVHLQVEAPGLATWAGWVNRNDSRELGEIVLGAGETVTVRVEGAPAGAAVVVRAVHEEQETTVEGRRAGDRYLLEELPVGRHLIRGAVGSLEAVPEVVDVLAAEVLPVVVLRFPPTVRLEGRVSIDGEAPGWGMVTLTSSDPRGDYHHAMNLEMDGRWAMEAVPGIPLRVEVVVNGGRAVREIDPSTTPSIAIDLLTGSLVGVVVDPEGTPVRGLELTANPPGATHHSPVRLATTDRDGRFRLDELLEGQWRLVARQGSGFLLLEDVAVEGGGVSEVLLQSRERPR